MATYLSMHIIACMTRQALNQLITTMQAAEEVRLVRASASQMAGRLLCEFDAPDQNRSNGSTYQDCGRSSWKQDSG